MAFPAAYSRSSGELNREGKNSADGVGMLHPRYFGM